MNTVNLSTSYDCWTLSSNSICSSYINDADNLSFERFRYFQRCKKMSQVYFLPMSRYGSTSLSTTYSQKVWFFFDKDNFFLTKDTLLSGGTIRNQWQAKTRSRNYLAQLPYVAWMSTKSINIQLLCCVCYTVCTLKIV